MEDDPTLGGEAKPAPWLRFELLGEPRWRLSTGRERALSPKDAALVSLLALDGPQAREVLAGQLWPGSTQHQAATSLRQRIKRLRDDTEQPIFSGGPSLSLVDGLAIDAHEVAALPVDALLDAGDLLAGCDFADNEFLDGWVAQRRERLRRQRADALAGHAERLEREGRLAAALQLAERIVTLVPLLEHGWRRLMRLHYLRGDSTAAVEAFERFEQILREQTGARPGAETRALLDTIERARPAAAPTRGPIPVSLVRPPVRVGREREWIAMERAWSAGRCFLVIGDAGIGKSRLLADLAHSRPGTLSERGRPGDGQTPYAVLGRLLHAVARSQALTPDPATRLELSRIAPGFGPAPQVPGQQGALWHAAEQLLEAAVAAGLGALLVDDLQYADVATVEALRWLCASPALAALHVGLACRPLEGGPVPDLLRQWLDDSLRPEPIELKPLSPQEVDELLASLGLPQFDAPGAGARLFAHAGGHPLFTLETLKDALLHGHDVNADALPRPSTVQALLDRRLEALPADARDLLRVAAVAGTDLTTERAARLLGRSALELADAWARLEQANVLQGLRFAHDLVHESALRLAPAAVRRVLHGALARLLAGDASVPPSRVAEHWQAAACWAEAAACWHAAGMAARLAGRLVEQHELLERAAACHREAGNAAGEFAALHAGIDSLLLRHGGAAVLDALPRLEALARSPQDRLLCLLVRAEALTDLERGAEAVAVASEAVPMAAHDPALFSDALCLQGIALAQTGRFDDAVEAEQKAAATAQAAGLPAQELRAVRSLAYVFYAAGRLASAIPVQQEALRLAEALGDQAEAAGAAVNLAAQLGVAGDVTASHDQAVQARRRCQDMGFGRASVLGCVNLIVLGMGAAYLASFDEALSALTEAVHMTGDEAVVSLRAKARLSLAGLWLTLGSSQQARPLLQDLPDDMMPGMQMQAALMLARADAIDGRSGIDHLERLGRLMAEQPALPLVQSAWIEWSYRGEAQTVVNRLHEVHAQCVASGLPGTARTVLCRIVDRLTELDSHDARQAATKHAAELLPHVADGMSAKTYPPEAWTVLARAFERGGDRASSEMCRSSGRRWIIERALPTVPLPYRDGFLRFNPVNRHLLATDGS